jgi:hypothetical protein
MIRGSAGGRETLKRYGVEHFRTIGKRGFDSFTQRYFAGDRQQATDWLRLRAHEHRIDGFADRELQRRLDEGQQITSIELPAFTDHDDVPF